MQDELKKFSAAALAGIRGASGEVAGVGQDVARAFASRVRAPVVSGAGGIGTLAGEVADQEETARKAAQAEKLRQLQDMIDPSKYSRQRKGDGGFAFYDPTGKEIDINTYAQRTGLRRVDALKDSENPLDLQYINDYSNMEGLMKAAYDGDNDTVNSILSANGLDKSTTPENYANELIKKYPHIYGVGRYEDSQRSMNKPVFKVPKQVDPMTKAIQDRINSRMGG